MTAKKLVRELRKPITDRLSLFKLLCGKLFPKPSAGVNSARIGGATFEAIYKREGKRLVLVACSLENSLKQTLPEPTILITRISAKPRTSAPKRKRRGR